MKNNIIFSLFILTFSCAEIFAQSENYAKFYNKGNKLSDKNFQEAEKNYRTAIGDSLSDLKATYNLSNKYYDEGLFDEAIARQVQATKLAINNEEKHKAFHNLGNSLINKEMCSEAVLAFKNALRNNPNDDETRYNLALAKKCEEDQNKENDNKDDQKEDNQDKDNKNKDDQKEDNQDKDNKNKDDQKEDNQDKDNENKDDQKKDSQNKEDQKKNKPSENKNNKQSKLSPQQIKNLLKAMENAEKKVQAKVNDKKQKGTKVVSEKDW